MVDLKQLQLFVPIFKTKIEDEARYCKDFSKWFIENKQRFLDLGIIPSPPQFIKRGVSQVRREEGYEYVDVQQRGKGSAITDYLNRLIVSQESSDCNTLKINYDYAIVIDGDFDIPLDTIFKVLKKLKEEEKIVLSCREGKFGLGKLRNKLERFELYLVEARHSVSLPDGQCGCWGFQANLYPNKIKLTSKEFEIELDILINALENGITPYFVITKVEQGGDTTFDRVKTISYKKLHWLCNKLQYDSKILNDLYDSFSQDYVFILDDDYVKSFSKFDSFEGISQPIGKDNKRKLCYCILWEEKTPEKPYCSRCDRKEWGNLKEK